MMKGKARVRRTLPWAVTLIGVMGLLAGMPAPVVGQLNLPQSTQQPTELEEAEQLNQQALQLYQQVSRVSDFHSFVVSDSSWCLS